MPNLHSYKIDKSSENYSKYNAICLNFNLEKVSLVLMYTKLILCSSLMTTKHNRPLLADEVILLCASLSGISTAQFLLHPADLQELNSLESLPTTDVSFFNTCSCTQRIYCLHCPLLTAAIPIVQLVEQKHESVQGQAA